MGIPTPCLPSYWCSPTYKKRIHDVRLALGYLFNTFYRFFFNRLIVWVGVGFSRRNAISVLLIRFLALEKSELRRDWRI